MYCMITREKLVIYEKFSGDIDGFSRGSSLSERKLITDLDWHLIDELVRGLSIVQAKLATVDFEESVRKRMLGEVQDELARAYLLRLCRPKP